MKKIINGKRYDTNTAKYLGNASYGNCGDFAYWSEDLYQKKTGEFFLYGEGGAMSKYSKSLGENEVGGGETIRPLSYKEAQEWVEKYLTGDEYEKIFGTVDETDEKNTVALRLTPSAVSVLKREAAKTGKTMSEIVEGLIIK